MDELIEETEKQVQILIESYWKRGLNYWQLEDMFLRATCDLHLKASAEYQAKAKGGE